MRKILLLTTAVVMATFHAYAQTKTYWSKTSAPLSEDQTIKSARVSPNAINLYELDVMGIKSQLQSASVRGARSTADLVITFPTPQGNLERFKVIEAPVMEPELAAKYPNIKSYAGQGIDDPTATIRFSLSDQLGFHGMILSAQRSAYYIDPYSKDRKRYSVYARESMSIGDNNFSCFTDESGRAITSERNNASGRTNDKKLRKYRLALSCNAEYGNIFSGTTGTDAQKKANILAQMNVTMTRVNGVYERDLAVTMVLVPNTDVLIYFGSTSTDPWSGEFNTKTQQVIDAGIGNANYDIGHNFNTSGGGNAGCIGCVCTTGSKGSGMTGSSNPTGDAFDIDYVAHEMGHQFGGYHTQSNSGCISGSGNTEVEPGSGSTVMSYAGICAANVQNNSDGYFHYVNIRDISANIQSGVSSSCAQVISLSNNPPTADAGPNYTIPKSTAFVLHGAGTDPDGDVLTYNWEQNDPQSSSSANNAAPTPTKASGPMFRSRNSTASPDRYFPQLSDVIANNLAPTWEVIPSVARTLNFALTVRDNKAGGGQTSDDLMVVTVNGTAGPFVVSAPNTTVTWPVGSSQTVTWSVANTNVAPVNCTNVNIKLSIDGGLTYPVTLLSNTPNDGTEAISVPSNASTNCRIKIEAINNIFYDISNADFTIGGTATCNATVPTGLSASSITASAASLSWNAVTNATYDLQYRATGAATWTTISSNATSTVITGLAASTAYDVQVRSKCTSTTSAFSASVNFTTGSVSTCTAIVPTGLSTLAITSSSATLSWSAVTGASYDVQYRAIGAATWTVMSSLTSPTASLTGLTAGTAYEAQVRSKCTSTTSAYSASVNFTTTTVGITYCASKGNSVTDEYINNVTLGTINNLSGANAGYGNFTALTTTLARGSANTIAITPKWASTTYNEGYSVWIDYNQDGDFTDAGEQVWTKAASTTTPVSGSFTVPTAATLGNTRMRVSMKYNAIPTACEAVAYGEVEDYTVTITAGGSGGTCTTLTVTIVLDDYPEETSWTIKNSASVIVASGGTYGSQPDRSTVTQSVCLPSGCNYTFTISDVYGDGICCSYGNGSYNVKDAGGIVLVSGATFTSSISHAVCVNTSTSRGDEMAFSENDNVSIHPNPVSHTLNVAVDADVEVKAMKIITTNGSVFYQSNTYEKSVNVSALPAGIFILHLETNKGIKRSKFSKE